MSKKNFFERRNKDLMKSFPMNKFVLFLFNCLVCMWERWMKFELKAKRNGYDREGRRSQATGRHLSYELSFLGPSHLIQTMFAVVSQTKMNQKWLIVLT